MARSSKKKHSAERYFELTTKRKKQGWYEDDADFPGDDDERWYWVRTAKTITAADVDEEEVDISMQQEITEENAAKMLDSNLFSGASTLKGANVQSAEFWKALEAAPPPSKKQASAGNADKDGQDRSVLIAFVQGTQP